jgi:hypothetical protein
MAAGVAAEPAVDPPETPAERAARGRSARSVVPRSAHAELTAPGVERDPVALLEHQAITRVPELVPIRYGRMLTSPFAFFRGAALIMAYDLAAGPRTGSSLSCAETPTCRTLGSSPRRSGGSCSTSTTSTRRTRARSSGT